VPQSVSHMCILSTSYWYLNHSYYFDSFKSDENKSNSFNLVALVAVCNYSPGSSLRGIKNFVFLTKHESSIALIISITMISSIATIISITLCIALVKVVHYRPEVASNNNISDLP
jgi:hypothetical protein